jgi:hypothetical protein
LLTSIVKFIVSGFYEVYTHLAYHYSIEFTGFFAGTAADAFILNDKMRLFATADDGSCGAFFGAYDTTCTFFYVDGIFTKV